MTDITKCIPGVQTSSENSSYSALPEKLIYPIGKKMSTSRTLGRADIEKLPSDLKGFICVSERDGSDVFYMSNGHQSALVEYFAPQNDPIVFSDYVRNGAAYPSFANFIMGEMNNWDKEMPESSRSFDSTEWSKPIGPLGLEEISLIVNALGSSDDMRILENPFSSDKMAGRAKIFFSNRLDETHFDTILNRLEEFKRTSAPAKLRLRLLEIAVMIEGLKEASMRGISQPSPLDIDDALFDRYENPVENKVLYEAMLTQKLRNPKDLGFFEDDDYTPFNARLFPEDVALIRMHLDDTDNDIFIERISSKVSKGAEAPRLYSIDFFTDFGKIDELLANIASTNIKLSHSGRSRIAELRREVGRLKMQKERWLDKYVIHPAYTIGGAATFVLFFKLADWIGGGGRGPQGPTFVQKNYYDGKLNKPDIIEVKVEDVAKSVTIAGVLTAIGYSLLSFADKAAGLATGTLMIIPGGTLPGTCPSGTSQQFDGGCYPNSI